MIAAVAITGSPPVRENSMYAAIRQGKAKTDMAEELGRRIKEGAIPIISDVDICIFPQDLNSLIPEKHSLFPKIFSLLICVGNCSRSGCSAAVSWC
jgi:hypothetical protein